MERAVIATLMMPGAGTTFLENTKELQPEYFGDDKCRWVFEAMRERVLQGKEIDDPLLLLDEVHRMGHASFTAQELAHIFACDCHENLQVEEYVALMKDEYLRNVMRRQLETLLKRSADTSLPIENVMAEATTLLQSEVMDRAMETTSLKGALTSLCQRVNENFAGKRVAGFLTGIEHLDKYGGLHPQDLVVIGAQSSHGKTALALGMVVNAACQSGTPVLVCSMEMSSLQLAARIVSPVMKVPGSVILYRAFRKQGLEDFDRAVHKLNEVAERIFIGDSTQQSLQGILASIRLHHARYGVRLVMVDYAQIVNVSRGRDQSREEALAEVGRSLKNIAIALDICIVLLSQVNRDSTTSGQPVPTSAQLRGSGQINEAADLTLMLYRPEMNRGHFPEPFSNTPTHGRALLRIDKDRNGGYGGTGEFLLDFDHQTMKFS